MDTFVSNAQSWAMTQFGAADLHDKRRTKRLVLLARQIAANPSGSFPQQTESWNDLRAAYNLFDCEDVTFQAIASHHWELTKKIAGEILLIIADTTEIDYGPCRQVTGLSPVGSGIGQGFHLHSGLMVSAEDDRVHGLAGQLIYHRQPVRKGETRTERLRRDDRESQIWANLVIQMGSPPLGASWIHVVDRGADDFEFFYHCQQTETEWVARAKSLIRIIITPEGRKTPLKAHLGTLPQAGRYTLNLRARPKAPARMAKLVIAFGALRMPTPKLQSAFVKQVKPATIPMWVVWVREVDAPDGVKAIAWVLYTSLPVESLEDAMTIVGYYEKRWLIEEWHKVLKTGFQVERRQLKTCDRLEAMMGLMSVEAVRLFQLKGTARTFPEQPATEVVPPKYVMVLKVVRDFADDSIDCGRILSRAGQAGRVPGPPSRW